MHQGDLTFSSIDPNAGLKRAIQMKRIDIIGEISRSKMRGRGGAGFPTGTKWNLAAAAVAPKKYIVCNADEGEPGTFKDRVILQEFADLVFAGMTIAGKAINALEGIVYLRAEYTYLLSHLEAVLDQRRKAGLLGSSIGGDESFSFDITIRMGSGAYICGEETALIESMEGFRGEPRNRPPYPVDTGFMKHPTVVNNVETFAWAACIIARGADWFNAVGTDKSTGYKLFSISGDVQRPGVYEFPMGIMVSDLLKEVGGSDAKAVQIGGASGHCVPASEFSRTCAFEDMSTGGSVIVFGPLRDMLDIAENFLEFFVEESCGQCTPCRIGNVKLLEGVRMLKEGTCSMTYLKELLSLGETMQLASKCGLGQSSPNAFLSIVRHFKPEIMGRVNL
ncbi:SLBB domain-containing protein [bacterium]|nr:SLBB domain-containing protein [candidate division CSSED10-310 bacterium]